MPEHKRTKMLAFNTRVEAGDPAGSIQKQIDAVEAEGHYVMQYIPVTQYSGVILAHDYPDKKNLDDGKKPASAMKPKPDEAGAPAVTDDLTTREKESIPPVNAPDLTPPAAADLGDKKPDPLVESAKDLAKNKGKRGRR